MLENFDLKNLKNSSFKEDSVREEIIMPILKELGFNIHKDYKIIRSQKLSHPFVTIGSSEKPISIFPDYLLQVNSKNQLVLDAKAPSENIRSGKNVNQVYSYAIHPEIRSEKFALCNGYEWVFFKITEQYPILILQTEDLENNFEKLKNFIFGVEQKIKTITQKKDDSWYLNLKLPKTIEKPKKNATKRHFGVHGYFTKQSWDIVDRHITHFTREDDLVLDPFGGSGVTLIESLMKKRKGIFIDINPLCVFWMETILNNANLTDILESCSKILKKFQKQRESINENSIKKFLPKNLEILSKGSDFKFVHEVFSKEQLLELGLLKKLILQEKNKDVKHSLLLAFSSSITKTNLTYHPSTTAGPNGGNAGIFMYYRYRKAPKPVFLDITKTFERKVKNVVKAKEELNLIPKEYRKKVQILKKDASNLEIEDESIDYIYTDPPYGKKIEYLDLSIIWNAWLDLEVKQEDFEKEAIEGGRLQKSKDIYSKHIINSLKEMFRVLKWNRWMSFVFQHQDPFYWYLIVENAEKIGFEYAGCIKQTNGQTSFKKRKNPFSVLSGQLIINFKKIRNSRSIMKFDLGMELHEFILNNIESTIAEKNGATTEEIHESLIIHSLELGFLHEMSKYKDIKNFLEKFHFDDASEKYHIKENKKFVSTIPLDKKIKYFLISYLKKK